MHLKLPSMIKGWLNTNLSPERLLTQYVSTGKQKYLALLVEHFNLALYHYLVSLSDKETAEDCLQSTWLKVIRVTSLNKQHTNVKSWLYTIARNTLIDELRRQQRWQFEPVSEQQLVSASLVNEIETSDRLAQFNMAIAQLPFAQREAFIFQQEGFSVMEIGQLTEQNFEAVKSRLRYARKNLQMLLEAHT